MSKKPVSTKPETENLPAVQATSGAVPAYLAGVTGTTVGQLEGIDSSDIARPVVRLLQATSKVIVEDGNPEAKPGNFWLAGADLNLGPSFDFVICANRKRFLLMAPINDSRGVLARADDGIHWTPPDQEFEVRLKNIKQPVKWRTAKTVKESGLAEFGSSNPSDPDSPPAAVLVYEHLILLPDHLDLGPLFFSCARSQVRKVRRELYPKIMQRNSSGIPMQALRFTCRAVEDRGEEGPFYNVSFAANGFVDKPTFEQAQELHAMMATFKPKVEETGEEEASAAGKENSKIAAKM